MSNSTPSLPRFKKTQDNYGYVSWQCNFCGWKTRQPQYPHSHQCGFQGFRRGNTRSSRGGAGRGRRSSHQNHRREQEEEDVSTSADERLRAGADAERVSDTGRDSSDQIEVEAVEVEVPSPFIVEPEFTTPGGPMPELDTR